MNREAVSHLKSGKGTWEAATAGNCKWRKDRLKTIKNLKMRLGWGEGQ